MDNAMAPEGWTAVPNDLLDNMGDLGNAELRVLLAIIRKTAGYQKECDRVSVSQIATMTGLTTRNAQAAITKLLESGHIGREQAGKQTYSYFVKPYPYGTRLDSIPTGHGDDAISPRDTEPYPLGTRNVVKPYPLGTTQKKDLKKEERDSSPASDDAVTPPADDGETIVTNTPNRNPTGRKMPPAAPLSIRQAMADVCQIDLDGGTASKGQVIDLNKQAGRAWKAAQAQGKTEAECAEAVRYVAGWIKKTVYPYTNGQPLKPAAILDRWRAAMDARPKPTAYANGTYTNGIHTPDDPNQYLTRDQLRALRRGES